MKRIGIFVCHCGTNIAGSVDVERVVAEKKPGSIIPILVGKPDGVREDYFFHKLDILIDALVKRGYQIVPVSVLIEHAE